MTDFDLTPGRYLRMGMKRPASAPTLDGYDLAP